MYKRQIQVDGDLFKAIVSMQLWRNDPEVAEDEDEEDLEAEEPLEEHKEEIFEEASLEKTEESEIPQEEPKL